MPLQDLFLDTKKIPPPYLYLYLIAWILKITFLEMLGTLSIEMKNKSILDSNCFFFVYIIKIWTMIIKTKRNWPVCE